MHDCLDVCRANLKGLTEQWVGAVKVKLLAVEVDSPSTSAANEPHEKQVDAAQDRQPNGNCRKRNIKAVPREQECSTECRGKDRRPRQNQNSLSACAGLETEAGLV